MNIYLASSWKNDIAGVVYTLRQEGHGVYDFQNPNGFQKKGEDCYSEGGFTWEEIDRHWLRWSPEEYKAALRSPIAKKGFDRDMKALRDCDAVVLMRPCGASAHSEAGWAAGAGKPVVVYLEDINKFPVGGAELMYKMFDYIATDIVDLTKRLRKIDKELNHERRTNRAVRKRAV